MTAAITLQSPIDESLQRLEPLVVLGDDLYIKTRKTGAAAGADDEAVFVTAWGVEHPLRPFLSRQTLNDHLVRGNQGAARQRLQAELERFQTVDYEQELRYFVEILRPEFLERDWSGAVEVTGEDRAEGRPPACSEDLADVLDAVAGAVPPLLLPSPSYLVLGRFWLLRTTKEAGIMGLDRVRRGHDTFGPTGRNLTVAALERRWHEDVEAYLAREAARLAQRVRIREASDALVQARAEVARVGHLQSGDVLFLPGNPPRIGHILPPHYNRTLGRECRRDLAMTANLTIPPRFGSLHVFHRGAAGYWVPLALPNGLCLGGGPPEDRPKTPGLALLAYLRWAAWRIAANGAFHASDDRPDSNDDF